MRRLIDADELRCEVDDLSNDMWHPVYGVTEDDIECANTIEAVETDWIFEYVDKCVGKEESAAIIKMLDTWYDELKPRRKRPTMTEAYNRGATAVKIEVCNAIQQMREELIARSKENRGEDGRKTEVSDNTPIQE
jgi:hypothetical protein